MIVYALTAAALAAPSAPAPPEGIEGSRMIMGCSSLDEIRALLEAFEGLPTGPVNIPEISSVLSAAEGYGVDASQPIWFAGGPDEDPVIIEMGVLDATRWKSRMKMEAIRAGSLPELSSETDSWRDEDGALVSLEVEGDRGRMTLTPADASEPGYNAISLLGAREDVGGCWAAMDLRDLQSPPGAAFGVEGVLFQQRAGSPSFRIALRTASAPKTLSQALSGRAPRREAIGVGTWPVYFSFRLNGALDEMLEAYWTLISDPTSPLAGRMPPPPPGLEALPAAPGTEVAIGFEPSTASPIFAIAIPMKRPGQARRARRRLARDLGLPPRGEGPLALDDDLWLRDSGRHLLVSNQPRALEELYAGQGDPWSAAAPDLAEAPGVFFQMDTAALRMIQLALPPSARDASGKIAASVRWTKPDLLVMDLYAPGLLDQLSGGGEGSPPPGAR